MVLAHQQLEESKKLQDDYKEQRPEFDKRYDATTKVYTNKLNDVTTAAVDRYKALAAQGIPEQQRQNYLTDISRQNTTSLSQSSSRRAGLSNITTINQSNKDAYRDLLELDAGQRLQGQYALAQAAPQYEMMPTQFAYGRAAGKENVDYQELKDLENRGYALEETAYENWQQGWAQLDEDIMTWMTMGASGGKAGGQQGGGQNQAMPSTQGKMAQNNQRKSTGNFSYGSDNKGWLGYGGSNESWLNK